MILEPLTIPGRSEMLTQLMDYVAWAAAGAGLSEQVSYRLSLAVDEIATNIVLHGYEGAGRHGNLTIWADTDAQRLRIFLEDTGEHFDPRQVPRPADLDRPLEERKDGGLGIYLALWGVDEFRYERKGMVNRCVFVVERSQP
ncbi:ATP-binding protein [Promineifilum sp.]|uniref:ATP-binding protein n=1 Tax=Promineifilum sp. TaxID=2664178 RepID=UPI0035B3B908